MTGPRRHGIRGETAGPALAPRVYHGVMTLYRLLWITLLCLAAPWVLAADGLKPVTVARGLVNPWSLAFLPDGRLLVTERPGRLRIVSPDGHLSPPVAGLPPIAVNGQCGLLEVLPDPQFKDNGWLYLSYAEPGEGGNSTAVGRARLVGNQLQDVKTIFVQKPKIKSSLHCGSRIGKRPVAGTKVKPRSTVNLYVSSGLPKVPVPDGILATVPPGAKLTWLLFLMMLSRSRTSRPTIGLPGRSKATIPAVLSSAVLP